MTEQTSQHADNSLQEIGNIFISLKTALTAQNHNQVITLSGKFLDLIKKFVEQTEGKIDTYYDRDTETLRINPEDVSTISEYCDVFIKNLETIAPVKVLFNTNTSDTLQNIFNTVKLAYNKHQILRTAHTLKERIQQIQTDLTAIDSEDFTMFIDSAPEAALHPSQPAHYSSVLPPCHSAP